MTVSQLTELLGWASLINVGFLCVTTFLLASMANVVTAIHSKVFHISKENLAGIYFQYLATYKTLTLVFFVAPYLSLKLMGN